jgi:iron-sulfur cluster repair protein YtfE (RIC family)
VVQSVLDQLKKKGFKENDAETISNAVGLLSSLVDQYSEFSEDQHKKLTDPMEAVLKVEAPKPPPPEEPASKVELEKLSEKLLAHIKEAQDQYKKLNKRIDELSPKGLEETSTTFSD